MIEAGTLLIEKNAPRPKCFQLAANPDAHSWAPVARDLSSRDREKALAMNGWTFSYLAGAIRATAFGLTPASRIAAALKRLIAIASRQRCNCLEIDEVAARSFLGLPYVKVSAHSRQIQKATAF